MSTMIIWDDLMGFVLRGFQSALWSAPYLLAGLAIASMLRAMVGGSGIRSLFGEGRWSGPPRAWLLGVLAPVSALGVLPILVELHRARVRPGTLAAFALSASAFHPLSVAYAASSLGPRMLGALLLASLVSVLIVGWIIAAIAPGDVNPPSDESRPREGTDRLRAMGVDIARSMTGTLCLDLSVGLVGAGLIGAFLSSEFLPPRLSAHSSWAVPSMALVATSSLVLPEKAIMCIVEMRKLGMDPGAMFVLVALGAGVGLGHLSWLWRTHGAGRAGSITVLVLCVTCAVAFGFDSVIKPTGKEDLDTHVFDEYTNPFYFHNASVSVLGGLYKKVFDGAIPAWPLAVLSLVALGSVGVWIRLRRPALSFESFASTSTSEASSKPGFGSRALPRRAIAAAGLGVSFLAILASFYAYYPHPRQVFSDLHISYADVYSSIQSDPLESTLGNIDLMERLASKLVPASLLRGRPIDSVSREKSTALLAKIEELREAVRTGHRDQAKRIGVELGQTYRECRLAYIGTP
jgi:uncharacterized protein